MSLRLESVHASALAPPTGDLAPAARPAELTQAEEALARAEAAIDEGGAADALVLLEEVRPLLRARPELELRALLAEAWVRLTIGDVQAAERLLERAQTLASARAFTDVDRAGVLFRLGCCDLKLSRVAVAVEHFTVALDLCDRSGLPCDRLRSEILQWRTRCYRRQRAWGAAQRDVERAIELAEGLDDLRLRAGAYFQASMVAERSGQLLVARFYAEAARQLYENAGDRGAVGRVLNNLGGICFLLGRAEEARVHLGDAFRLALDAGATVDAAYAVSSSAQVLLQSGDPALAEQNARYALQLLTGREDHVNEIGNAQLVLGRALLEQGRLEDADDALRRAEESFARMDSAGHRAAALLARGDLAARRGDAAVAADLYRAAAELLQDVRF